MKNTGRSALIFFARAILIITIIFWIYLSAEFLYNSEDKYMQLGFICLGIAVVLFITLLIAWNLEKIGGIVLIGEGMIPFVVMWNKPQLLITAFWLGLPTLISGILFFFAAQRALKIETHVHPELTKKIEHVAPIKRVFIRKTKKKKKK